MAYETYVPIVRAAAFSANPANINAKIVLTVKVAEVLMILSPEIRYAGEIYAGEV